MKRRKGWSILMSGVLGVGLVLAGCSAQPEQGAVDNPAKSEAADGTQTLIIARQSDANNLDPHFISAINAASVVHHKVYEGLIRRDENMEFKPMLATEWKQLDEVTWEFKLRQGVVFHDGTPFNAEAVKATFARVLDPKVGSPRATQFQMIQEVKAVDDYTVQIKLTYPYSPLLSILANHEGSIISPKAIEQYGKDLSKHPVGTGPFVFEAWTPGQEIVLARNDNYWGEKVKYAKAVFKVVPEDTTRIAMVETGEAHIAEPLPVTEIERVSQSPQMALYRTEGLGTDFIGFNTKKKPFDDVRVRQAINYAIETDAIIQGVFNNVGTKANSAMSPKVLGYSEALKGYEFDPNKAKALLKEAGYANGFKTTLWTGDRKERINAAEVIQSQLKGIGVEVEVKVLEYGAYLDAEDNGETDMFISGWGNATGDGDYNQYNLFHSSSFGKGGNTTFYVNKEVDKLIEEARREPDSAKRKQLYAQALEIESKEAPMVPIRNLEHVAAVSKKIKGFWISPSGYMMINDITME
ncbi:glutathione ABC transporter substrate-binding protein [Brevibacillus parabrevis]|uniref:glutathione ABC transporter substrate-binding protein n=1 Tax=Brevibacillus parabrevis TaxID=54914 RepID=UPI00238077FB|nr:glutathione ABC transporter substrate-binding protein [Brevibacillus parabrevis]WDV96866.1 glutathione ABC transporter substrate-binding protein [Brevibacillus parabrevis]